MSIAPGTQLAMLLPDRMVWQLKRRAATGKSIPATVCYMVTHSRYGDMATQRFGIDCTFVFTNWRFSHFQRVLGSHMCPQLVYAAEEIFYEDCVGRGVSFKLVPSIYRVQYRARGAVQHL